MHLCRDVEENAPAPSCTNRAHRRGAPGSPGPRTPLPGAAAQNATHHFAPSALLYAAGWAAARFSRPGSARDPAAGLAGCGSSVRGRVASRVGPSVGPGPAARCRRGSRVPRAAARPLVPRVCGAAGGAGWGLFAGGAN